MVFNVIKYIILFIFISCSANVPSYQNDRVNPNQGINNESTLGYDPDKLKALLAKHDESIKELETSYSNIDKKIKSLESLMEKSNSDYSELKQVVKDFKQAPDQTSNKTINNDFLITLRSKIKILEDKAFYNDSLYFELINDLVMIDNKISSLNSSYKEMLELKTKGVIKEIPPISDEEYKAKYIEALSNYQNGEWNKSLNKFTFLIGSNMNHDLADNCQYWIAEVYYSRKDYKRAIVEFNNVFTFPGTNKADDSYYKLGLCFVNIGDEISALENFQKLIQYYPESEFTKKSVQYIQQLK